MYVHFLSLNDWFAHVMRVYSQSVVENLLRDYELRKENKQLTAEQEEMLTTDPNNPVNEEGVPFYDDKVDTVEAGYRPGTSWLKSQRE